MINYVRFNEENHIYTNSYGKRYISTTQLIDQYKQPFDESYWSLFKAFEKYIQDNGNKNEWWKHKRALQNIPKNTESILRYISDQIPKQLPYIVENQEWFLSKWDDKRNEACEKGTSFHKKKELLAYQLGEHRLGDTDIIHKTATQYHFDLSELPDGYYSELLLYNHEYEIAGQTDMVWITTDYKSSIRYIDLNDWKGFALDTVIPTPTGWTTIGEVKVGDTIFDGNGKPTKVQHVSEIHHNPCYKIIFDTKDELICDHEHRWEVSWRNKHGFQEEAILTTEEIIQKRKDPNIKIKIKSTALELPDVTLPIDPYVLGVWLADGNRGAGTITKDIPALWEEIKKRGYTIGEDISSENRTETHTIFGLYSKLKKLNLIKNKHIPDIYLRASHKQRLDLLRGFMDGDGYFNRLRKRCIMSTTQEWQADAIKELCASLGFKPTKIACKKKGFGRTNIPAWDVCFSPPENPFLIRNQDYFEIVKPAATYSEQHYIRSIEKVDTVPTKCLGVESESHTYLAGKGFIKTHNTNSKITTENKYQRFLEPIAHLEESKKQTYELQLSIYAWMLEQFGFTPRNLRFTWIKEDPILGTEEEVPFIVNYMKEEVEAMLTHYKSNGFNRNSK